MSELLDEMLPETVDCPHCGSNMTLDEQERMVKIFSCPACSEVIDFLSDEPAISLSEGMKKCPFCAEEIQETAILCKHCHSDLSAQSVHPSGNGSRPAKVSVKPEAVIAPPKNERKQTKGLTTNILAIVCASAMLVSVFLPWVQISSGPLVSGMHFGAGIVVALLSVAGGIVASLNRKWGAFAGALNIVIAIGFIVWWFKFGSSYSLNTAYVGLTARAPTPPQIGLYLLLLASASFIAAIFLWKQNGAGKSVNNRKRPGE